MSEVAKSAPGAKAPQGEDNKIDATVWNRTNWKMVLTGSNLDWGKFVSSPVDVPANGSSKFFAEGREWSPSGTEGSATWVLEGHPQNPTITVHFDNPAVGPDRVSIDVTPPVVAVNCDQTRGDWDVVTYWVG